MSPSKFELGPSVALRIAEKGNVFDRHPRVGLLVWLVVLAFAVYAYQLAASAEVWQEWPMLALVLWSTAACLMWVVRVLKASEPVEGPRQLDAHDDDGDQA